MGSIEPTDEGQYVSVPPIPTLKLLTCPIRGPLTVAALASDGLTPTEEARRIELIQLLLDRGYPADHIAVETVILKRLGEKGRNNLRVDLLVHSVPIAEIKSLPEVERLNHAVLVAEVKRDQKSKKSGIDNQLRPALLLLPKTDALGIYWDDVNQLLLIKRLSTKAGATSTVIDQDNIANLPAFGIAYKAKPITLADLRPATNLVGVLHNLANIFRSYRINDEATRYRETVKLILARYCDEREAKTAPHELALQVLPGTDPKFMDRVLHIYGVAASRYQKAATLFDANAGKPTLGESAMREAVKLIEGYAFTAADSEVMQQIFMSFVPAVFKKSLDQYFTPLSLIEAMVDMADIGMNDIVADPAMGTADFLSAAITSQQKRGDDDIVNRVYGADADKMAFDLAVVNMILHKDGQSNFLNEDSLENVDRWAGSVSVAFCNPPFGEKSIESRLAVLKNYDLGRRWEYSKAEGWRKTDEYQTSQQLGILFIEKCYRLLGEGGRLAIVLPEGYLCTASYGYVRRWIIEHFQILSLVELPRRIFNRADADLRANILIARKLAPTALEAAQMADYPIHAELVRRVGVKMGKGFSLIPQRDPMTGTIVRDEANNPVIDSDFTGVRERFKAFRSALQSAGAAATGKTSPRLLPGWDGSRYSDIVGHPDLDMKPRRLTPKTVALKKRLKAAPSFQLREVADVLSATMDLSTPSNFTKAWRLVEGTSIRAVEGTVVPAAAQRAWQVIEEKQRKVYQLKDNDIVIGLVRPERRNVGLLLDGGTDIVGAPDGIAVVRVRPDNDRGISQEVLFALLRSETARIQLWTESGGTSYGKLKADHIENLTLPLDTAEDRAVLGETVKSWAEGIRAAQTLWNTIGTAEDRTPIINSPIFGLEVD